MGPPAPGFPTDKFCSQLFPLLCTQFSRSCKLANAYYEKTISTSLSFLWAKFFCFHISTVFRTSSLRVIRVICYHVKLIDTRANYYHNYLTQMQQVANVKSSLDTPCWNNLNIKVTIKDLVYAHLKLVDAYPRIFNFQ